MEKIFIQGLIVTAILVVIQVWLNNTQDAFMSYLPPLGFAFFAAAKYFVQPLIVGAINIALINRLHKTRGWQVGIWLNGFFLLLAFLTVNLLLQITFSLSLIPNLAIIDLVVLSFPFGCISKFSNGGWSKPIN